MTRTVYVNGEYLPEDAAKISVFDRGFLFADAVYEVTSVIDGKLIDFAGHMTRLNRSLGELSIPAPADADQLLEIHRELLTRNSLENGLIYLQVSRGAADRDFLYGDDMTPSLVLFTQAKDLIASPAAKTGLRIVSVPDIRWKRRDIKTVQLLSPSLAKMTAKHANADDAWMIEDGYVTEGTSNNAYIVKDGQVITRNLSNDILHGITRAATLRLANEAQISVVERPFTIAEAQAAEEAFITSASAFVMPVVEIDGTKIGNGKPGPIGRQLREIYIEESKRTAI